jgi:hypothetical protein
MQSLPSNRLARLLDSFVIVGLPADSGGERALVATAVIDCRQGTPRPLPDSMLSALGQSLFDAGDAVRL